MTLYTPLCYDQPIMAAASDLDPGPGSITDSTNGGRQRRTRPIHVRALAAEEAAWKARARELGLSVSEWARRLLNLDVYNSGSVSGEVAGLGLNILEPRIDLAEATARMQMRNRARRDERVRLRRSLLAFAVKDGVTVRDLIDEIKRQCPTQGKGNVE